MTPDEREDHRHQCEVRHLIQAANDWQRGRGWVRTYLADRHVAARADRLRRDLNAQIARGNTGAPGEWK